MDYASLFRFIIDFRTTFILIAGWPLMLAAQQAPKLKVAFPTSDSTIVAEGIAFFKGQADPSGMLFLNGNEVQVYRTGMFAAPLHLTEGDNELHVRYIVGSDTVCRRMVVVYKKPAPPQPTSGFAIDDVRLSMEGDLWLQPGDLLQVEMKASPGMKATFYKGIPLFEVDTADAEVAGIYPGEYVIQPSDSLMEQAIRFVLYDETTQQTVTKDSRQRITVLNQSHALTGLTKTNDVPLFYGLGTDRLGGAKMGYLDSLVKLEITGKMNDMYRLRLSEQVQAYVPIDFVRLQQGVHFRPYSLTGSWMVSSDSTNDFIRIGLNERLPYTAIVQHAPTRIVVDIYGAVSNSNWITQKDSLIAIENVWYEQVSKDVFRVYIETKQPQLWGYDVGYSGTQLVIRVKAQPPKLDLGKLRVAVDAGHGGRNRGATGMTGALEKDLNLSMALKLKTALERIGTTVIMTRETDRSFNNGDRLTWLKAQHPDLLISIHCNASVNPLVQGTSTYYRHHAYRPLSRHILAQLRKLGLADFGNVGGFNFALNAPTGFPSALVEVAFLSNPADEERLLDIGFHDEVAERIVDGLRDFLEAVQ
ncbi:N-acetylmuramoyl-L-alanine amidase [Parapedobacter luteus]|uniref:N-acetylmuramoyl-L-alanine amidase n=1 Tax=Parapedobacter luteus TaxID=623280 RepID=A0A1T5FK46_9SPHI|nr:N-acetylmuramoyl-L-alanine amidase [Parapedobacter luteus]SKB96472.1 N-acetylmuramoyl-L-alanine amidase [Parapedobacter luteus]